VWTISGSENSSPHRDSTSDLSVVQPVRFLPHKHKQRVEINDFALSIFLDGIREDKFFSSKNLNLIYFIDWNLY
jgi:hypothetical protein